MTGERLSNPYFGIEVAANENLIAIASAINGIGFSTLTGARDAFNPVRLFETGGAYMGPSYGNGMWGENSSNLYTDPLWGNDEEDGAYSFIREIKGNGADGFSIRPHAEGGAMPEPWSHDAEDTARRWGLGFGASEKNIVYGEPYRRNPYYISHPSIRDNGAVHVFDLSGNMQTTIYPPLSLTGISQNLGNRCDTAGDIVVADDIGISGFHIIRLNSAKVSSSFRV
jgi:hypothetical protein